MLHSEADILQVVYHRSHQIRVRRRVMRAGTALAVVLALAVGLPTLLGDSDTRRVHTVDNPDRLDTPSTTTPAPPPAVGDDAQNTGAGPSPEAGRPLAPSSPSTTAPSGASGAPSGNTGTAPSQDRIAYTRLSNLYVANLDGTNARHVAGSVASAPSWSPDGARIAYVHCEASGEPPFGGECSGDWGVTVVNADGSQKRRLTAGFHPTWSPDGNWIAFVSNGISVIRPDGTGERQLLGTADSPMDLDWSPDGTRIAFSMRASTSTCVPPVCDGHVYVVNADGSNLRQITFEAGDQLDPAWSPDGERIVFTASGFDVSGDGVIYTVKPDGTGLTKLTENPRGTSGRPQGRDSAPDWTPDGKIVWVQDPGDPGNVDGSGTAELYLMNSDGSGPVLLFEGGSPAVAPRRR